MLNSPIFATLAAAEQANQFALENKNRAYGLQFATVTNNSDPLNLRRIRVTTESKGGLIETDWLMAMRLVSNYDPPLPAVGTSVVIAWIDGDPHDGVWLGPVINQTNPQDDDQSDPVNDSTQTIPGDQLHRVDQDMDIKVGQKFRLQNDAGAYLELNEAGYVELGDAFGHKWQLGGSGVNQNQWIWDFDGASAQIINAAGFSINGKQILVIGSTDSDGDVNNTRGY